ncbi:MAG TPA: glycosyltransferase family 4 protein [Gemmataceae bacterium]|nr:glycosyltransferase family 4 protein [Gemmataceae bacterium]
MYVAHCIQRYPPALGGSEAYFARLSRSLVDAGDQVRVWTTNALDLEAFWSRQGRCLPAGISLEDGVEIHRHAVWRWPGRRYLLKALSFFPNRRWQCWTLPCNPIAWGMWRGLQRPQPPFALVHATAFPYAWPIVCGLRLAQQLHIPFLLTPFLHLGDPDDPDDRTRRAYLCPALRTLLYVADRVFVQTKLERAMLLELGIAPERLVLLGMGVEGAECTGGDRLRVRSQWQVAGDEVVIGHLANNSREKGSVDLLRAAEQLWQSGQRFRVVLAGSEMPNFRSFWKHYGWQARVHRLGVLSPQQKRDFFAGIDLFALPSRSDSFGLVLLEAWANGVPNVGYRAGGVAELIRSGEDGFLVRCGDVHELAKTLGRLIADESLRIRLGADGRNRIRQEFRWKEKLDCVRSTYHEAIEERHRGGARRINSFTLLRSLNRTI